MQFALVNDLRTEAFPRGRGICPTCGASMLAKCGPRIKHHWSHIGRKQCDPWWENESDWHREWKNHFPEMCREISCKAQNGEIHRADVITPTGIVIEIQHSAMTDDERISRETFYKNLVWIIDGRTFEKNFFICHMLPNPDSVLAQDLVWNKAKLHMNGANEGIFMRLSENQDFSPGATKATLRGGWVHGIDIILDDVKNAYNGYHQYYWVKPRKTWLDAECPVYIDFGGELLVKLEIYDESLLPCIRYVSKQKFIHDAMTENNANEIATKFYRIT